MPAVTILLPVFNAAATLGPTLASLFAQTFRDFELLVIDDGSSDATTAILSSVNDSRLRVLRNPARLRLAGALNRGIDEAHAPLIARMDADDIAHPTRLARQVAFLEQHPEILICGTWTRHFGDRRKARETYPRSWESIRAFSLFNCPFAHPSVVFRTQSFRQEQLRYDGDYYPTEDYELWSRIVHTHPCANLPKVLLDYRVHAHSMTGSDWSNMDEQACRVIQNQFRSLGVPCDDAQSRLHRDIGMARVRADDVSTAHDWLASLLAHNDAHPFCPPQALHAEILERWFHVCMNLRGPHPDRARLYNSPALWRNTSPPLHRQALLTLSTLRHKRK
jgi:glycosyltransferase involved in cell wall biosynthesis